MLKINAVFSGFSVNDIEKAKEFYGKILGFSFKDDVGGTRVQLTRETEVWMYQKDDHQPATYTVLNIVVDDIDAAMIELEDAGVVFEHYPGSTQDENGIMRGKSKNMGPDIAWFKDPSGNIISLIET